MGPQNKKSIHGAETPDRNALRQVYQFGFLLRDDFLHGIALIGSQRDARIFEVEVEAIDFQRLGRHSSRSGSQIPPEYTTVLALEIR